MGQRHRSPRSFTSTGRMIIVSFGIGIALIAIGIATIEDSEYMASVGIPSDGPGDVWFGYPAWNEVQLASGIILTLLGTASATASLTYAAIMKKLRAVSEGK